MKAIFLDIDGVLNSATGSEEYIHGMEVSKLKLLKQLLEDTACYDVVLTTDRRYSDIQKKQLEDTFDDFGIPITSFTRRPGKSLANQMWGVEDEGEDNRGKQIADEFYIFHPDKFVILDDNDDGISEIFEDKFILVNRFFGLNNDVYKAVIEKLGRAEGTFEELNYKIQRFLHSEQMFHTALMEVVIEPDQELLSDGYNKLVLCKNPEFDCENEYEVYIKKIDNTYKVIVTLTDMLNDESVIMKNLEDNLKDMNLNKRGITYKVRQLKRHKGVAYYVENDCDSFDSIIGFILDTVNMFEGIHMTDRAMVVYDIDEEYDEPEFIEHKKKINC